MQIRTAETDRKKIAKAVADFLETDSKYAGPPTFAYTVGDATVDREGVIHIEDDEKGEALLNELTEQGFMEGTENRPEAGDTNLVIRIPLADMTVQGWKNLLNMIHSKQYLLNKAIKTKTFQIDDALITALGETEIATLEEAITMFADYKGKCKGISFADGCILFSGFPFKPDSERTLAYTDLASAMVETAKKQKKVNPKETIEENEKFYMRTWLVRLGLGGKEKKETRQVLLNNLKGHTAFRTEADREKWQAKQQERRSERQVQEG